MLPLLSLSAAESPSGCHMLHHPDNCGCVLWWHWRQPWSWVYRAQGGERLSLVLGVPSGDGGCPCAGCSCAGCSCAGCPCAGCPFAGCTFRSCWVGAALCTQLPLLRVQHLGAAESYAQAHPQKVQNLRTIPVSWWKPWATGDQTNGLISSDVSKLLQLEVKVTWEEGREWEQGTNTKVVPLGTTGVWPGPHMNSLSAREMSCELWSKVLISQSPTNASLLWPLLFSRWW